MTSALRAVRRPLAVSAFALALLNPAVPARAQKPVAAGDLRSVDAYAMKAMKDWKVPGNRLLGKPMVTFVVDGTPKVASMKLENIDEFVRVPAKDTTKTDSTSKTPDGDR
jgi:hypothetical protein